MARAYTCCCDETWFIASHWFTTSPRFITFLRLVLQMIRENWNFFEGLDLDSVWRKHTQFATLRRPHAQLVLRERHVERSFARLCYNETEKT